MHKFKKRSYTLHTAQEDIVLQDGKIAHTGSQLITDAWKAGLAEDKSNSTKKREKNFMHVASIPVIFVNKWKREGFDLLGDKNITHKDVLRRLREEGLDDFIATNKRV